MWNVELDDSQAGIKIAWRNINHLLYADDTTLMAESEEDLKSLLMKVKKESEKAGLKLNIPIISWQIDGEKGSLLHCWWECKLVQSLWRTIGSFLKN